MGKRASDETPKTKWDVLWIVLSNPKVIGLLLIWAGGSTAYHSDTVKNYFSNPLPPPAGETAVIIDGGFEAQVRQAVDVLNAKILAIEEKQEQAIAVSGRSDGGLEARIEVLEGWHGD